MHYISTQFASIHSASIQSFIEHLINHLYKKRIKLILQPQRRRMKAIERLQMTLIKVVIIIMWRLNK